MSFFANYGAVFRRISWQKQALKSPNPFPFFGIADARRDRIVPADPLQIAQQLLTEPKNLYCTCPDGLMLLHCILTGLLRLVVQLLQDGHHVLALLAVVLGICGGENIPSWQFSTSGGISIDRDIIVSLQKSTARFSFLALSLSNIFLLTFSIWSLISITFGSVSQSRISSSSNMSPGKLQKRPCVSYQLSHLSPEINRAQSRKKKWRTIRLNKEIQR